MFKCIKDIHAFYLKHASKCDLISFPLNSLIDAYTCLHATIWEIFYSLLPIPISSRVNDWHLFWHQYVVCYYKQNANLYENVVLEWNCRW